MITMNYLRIKFEEPLCLLLGKSQDVAGGETMEGNQARNAVAGAVLAAVGTGTVWVVNKGIPMADQARTGNIKAAGGSLVASLRDYLDPALQNAAPYNERLNIFCQACSIAAQVRFRPERRQAFRDVAASATDIGADIRRLHLNDPKKPDINKIHRSIDELEKAIGRL